MRVNHVVFRPLALIALAAAACTRDATGPAAPSFDAQRVSAGLQALNQVLDSPVWRSFRALGAVPVAGQDAPLSGGPAAVPRLPGEVRGVTYVLDTTAMRYVRDSSRVGAPANGIRLILYAVNPVNGRPAVQAEIGYADLTDEGDTLPDGVSLRLRVVSAGTTYLDYLVTAAGSDSSGSLTAAGFTTDGISTLRFDIGLAGMRAGAGQTNEVQFRLAIPDRGFAAVGTARNTDGPEGSSGHVGLQVAVGADTIGFEAQGTADRIAAAFAVNGSLFATVTGDPRNPEIRAAGGRELAPEERAALQGLTQLVGGVFDMFGHLVQPAGAILELKMLP